MARKLAKEVIDVMMTSAKRAASKAYCIYSGVRVGASVLTANDRLFVGANVENASYGLTTCAERVAIQNAVTAGERSVVAVAVFSPDIRCITPCGACRQVMAEFAPRSPPGVLVIVEGKKGPETIPLKRLLPAEFRGSRKAKC